MTKYCGGRRLIVVAAIAWSLIGCADSGEKTNRAVTATIPNDIYERIGDNVGNLELILNEEVRIEPRGAVLNKEEIIALYPLLLQPHWYAKSVFGETVRLHVSSNLYAALDSTFDDLSGWEELRSRAKAEEGIKLSTLCSFIETSYGLEQTE